MPDVGVTDGGEEDDEEREEKKGKRKDYVVPMLTAVADSRTLDRYCWEVSKCDGVVTEKTLRWLRVIDQLPESLQMTVAWLTAKEPQLTSLRQHSGNGADWPSVRVCLAHNLISADFCCVKRDKLRELTQKSGESIRVYLKMYETLMNEASEDDPKDQ